MYRILLVDDEILVRDAIRENIDWGAMDCQLVGDCENGRQAMEFVTEHPVDIVLTDICMPYMDGMELSKFLHEKYPDIFIVIFSGFGEFEYAQKAIRYGVSEYLLKPVTAMELREVIGRVKEKVDEKRGAREQMDSLLRTSEDYRDNALMIRSGAIEGLVSCTRDIQESLRQLERLGIHLDAQSYRVAILDLDAYSQLFQIEADQRQESQLMTFVLFNISDEIVSRENAGIAYQEGSSRVCVLFTGEKNKEFESRIQTVCKEIQEKAGEAIGMGVSVGIGGWVRSLAELHFSHEQAQKAIECRYLLGGNLLINMEDEKEQESGLSIQVLLENLAEGMKSGEWDLVQGNLDQIVQLIQKARVGKTRACGYLQQIIRTIGLCLGSVTGDHKKELRQRESLQAKIPEQRTFCEAVTLVEEYAKKSFEELQMMNSSSGHRQAALAMDYIKTRYMQPDLNLNQICSYLNISTSYFSTVFKELTGETFIEVLGRLRIEKAMELLESTTLKNYEIAEKVGFADPHYFGICFKKMTGKTPTEYAREKRR
ncbi:MAG: response regulator [Blautia glucerasea]|nr:response regulator [Blautia glucerasea]MDY3085591.1 response regulator [Blautia sp.]